MFQLRPYQQQAIDALFEYFETNNGHPIISLPTASGKSIVQAAFIAETLRQWPGERFLLVSHVKELLAQNASKLAALGIDCGIYSAGLKQRDIKQITVAGIQSIYRRSHELGNVSIVIVDECHLISKTDASMYRSFIDSLQQFCPSVRVVGMSATPFRLDSGPLHKGDKRLFTDIAYSVSIKELIDSGYLSPLVTAPVKQRVNTDGVKKRGGEYITGELEHAMDQADITKGALDEVDRLCSDRKSWLVFCVGVEHAAHVAAAIKERGHACEVVVGTTPAHERQKHLEDFKAGRLRALVSVGVLTTGLDVPCADALICLRPTCSPGLWIQIVGRVTRLNPGKRDGLVLDFTNNTKRHGPIDLIEVDSDGNVKEAPCKVCIYCGGLIPPPQKACPDCGKTIGKVCPACGCPMEIGQVECPGCGIVTIRERKIQHETKASTSSIISDGKPLVELREVKSWDFKRHKKEGKPDSIRVRYWCGLEMIDEWICFSHGGYATSKAASWWSRHGGRFPQPKDTAEALSRAPELVCPRSVTVKRDGKWWRVFG